jgi:hypothetical protein
MPRERKITMSWKEYYEGVRFIKSVASTPEEAKTRLLDWKKRALPLVGKTLDSERASV